MPAENRRFAIVNLAVSVDVEILARLDRAKTHIAVNDLVVLLEFRQELYQYCWIGVRIYRKHRVRILEDRAVEIADSLKRSGRRMFFNGIGARNRAAREYRVLRITDAQGIQDIDWPADDLLLRLVLDTVEVGIMEFADGQLGGGWWRLSAILDLVVIRLRGSGYETMNIRGLPILTIDIALAVRAGAIQVRVAGIIAHRCNPGFVDTARVRRVVVRE